MVEFIEGEVSSDAFRFSDLERIYHNLQSLITQHNELSEYYRDLHQIQMPYIPYIGNIWKGTFIWAEIFNGLHGWRKQMLERVQEPTKPSGLGQVHTVEEIFTEGGPFPPYSWFVQLENDIDAMRIEQSVEEYGTGYRNRQLEKLTGENHRNRLFCGANLGSYMTNTQKEAIDSGTFDGLHLGDYWSINGLKWYIVGFNFFPSIAKNHVVLFPSESLGSSSLIEPLPDGSDTEAYLATLPYFGDYPFFKDGYLPFEETLRAAFGDYIAPHAVRRKSRTGGRYAWFTVPFSFIDPDELPPLLEWKTQYLTPDEQLPLPQGGYGRYWTEGFDYTWTMPEDTEEFNSPTVITQHEFGGQPSGLSVCEQANIRPLFAVTGTENKEPEEEETA